MFYSAQSCDTIVAYDVVRGKDNLHLFFRIFQKHVVILVYHENVHSLRLSSRIKQ